MNNRAPTRRPILLIIAAAAFVLFIFIPAILFTLLALGIRTPAIDDFIQKNQIGLGWAYLGMMIFTIVAFRVLQRRN
jgi:hypothetical protein